MYLDKDAVQTFVVLTDIIYDLGLVSDDDFIQRLKNLRQMLDPADEEQLRILEIRFYGIDEFRIEASDAANLSDKNLNDLKNTGGDQDSKFQGDDFDPQLHFITANSGKISKWEFHKTDSDFFPSIPHGHAIINHKIKLDCYLGHIYKDNKRHGRESREFIVGLWNDKGFREHARATIEYYLQTYPHYHWRVLDPLRIPRRRKWS